MGCTSKLSLR